MIPDSWYGSRGSRYGSRGFWGEVKNFVSLPDFRFDVYVYFYLPLSLLRGRSGCSCSRYYRSGSKHLHSLVDGGALLPVATERRRNAPKRGGAAGPKDDSVL